MSVKPVAGFFLDSNVVTYSLAEEQKAERAAELLRAGPVISAQVLNEVANVLQRKFKLDWDQVYEFVIKVRNLADRVVPVTAVTNESAIAIAARYKLNFYDAVIAAAALNSGCDTLYSEDMHNGLIINGRLTIVNPFA